MINKTRVGSLHKDTLEQRIDREAWLLEQKKDDERNRIDRQQLVEWLIELQARRDNDMDQSCRWLHQYDDRCRMFGLPIHECKK